MNKRIVIGSFLAAMCGILLCAAVYADALPRPEYGGFAPAVPMVSQVPGFEGAVPFYTGQKSVNITLEIDAKGKVVKGSSEKPEDSAAAVYVLSSVGKIPFLPAVKNGTEVLSKLPIEFTYNPRYRFSKVEFPVESVFQTARPQLYFKALELNGINLPKVKRFPSYFCSVEAADSLAKLPYVLMKLELDESGKVNSTQVVGTNLPAFSEQARSASLWAEFNPLVIDGKPSSGSCFLLVSYFPQLQYPTKPVDFEKDSVFSWHDKWRVRTLADNAGLLNPAFPKLQKIGELPLTGNDKYLFGEVTAGISIDSSGIVRFTGSDTKQDKLNAAVRLAVNGLKFFPAVDFSGKPRAYQGSAKFTFSNRTNVRVEYLWLEN